MMLGLVILRHTISLIGIRDILIFILLPLVSQNIVSIISASSDKRFVSQMFCRFYVTFFLFLRVFLLSLALVLAMYVLILFLNKWFVIQLKYTGHICRIEDHCWAS